MAKAKKERKKKEIKLDILCQTNISSKIYGDRIIELRTNPNYRSESDLWRKLIIAALENKPFKL